VRDKNLAKCQEENRGAIADLILQKRLLIAIAADPQVDGYHVDILCEDGVVTLGGHVHSSEEHRQVREILRTVPGIKDVWDGIRVKPYRTTLPSPGKPFDH